jgi:hypothetical protein
VAAAWGPTESPSKATREAGFFWAQNHKSNKDSDIKNTNTNAAIYIAICLFCFFMSILNLMIFKILRNVNRHLVNTYKFVLKSFNTYTFEFLDVVPYHNIM